MVVSEKQSRTCILYCIQEILCMLLQTCQQKDYTTTSSLWPPESQEHGQGKATTSGGGWCSVKPWALSVKTWCEWLAWHGDNCISTTTQGCSEQGGKQPRKVSFPVTLSACRDVQKDTSSKTKAVSALHQDTWKVHTAAVTLSPCFAPEQWKTTRRRQSSAKSSNPEATRHQVCLCSDDTHLSPDFQKSDACLLHSIFENLPKATSQKSAVTQRKCPCSQH